MEGPELLEKSWLKWLELKEVIGRVADNEVGQAGRGQVRQDIVGCGGDMVFYRAMGRQRCEMICF